MHWEKLPYWLKGGIIAAAISLLVQIIIMRLDGVIRLPYQVAVWFIIGAFIGWIIGRTKRKKAKR